MRILTYTSLFPNSLAPNFGIFLLQRTMHLARRKGNQVRAVAPLPFVPKFLSHTPRGGMAAVKSLEDIAGLEVHHPRYPLLPGISMPLHALLMYAGCRGTVRALHRQHQFDCIDAHYVFPDGLAAVLIGKWLGIPVTVTARGSDIHSFPKFRTIRPQIRWALRNADAVSAVCNSLGEIMLELEPSLHAIEVIGNGVDRARFFPEEQIAARKRIGIAPDERLILSVAALKGVKGPDLLVRAASLLKRGVPKLRVMFVGQGPELSDLQQLSAQLGCADVCRFAGVVKNEELRYYYSAADVSCLPSRNEGWPNVVLESLACGTPVVGTRVGAVPEILASAGLGLVVESTPAGICHGLQQALEFPWDRDGISQWAQAHTWERVAERVDNFLRDSLKHEIRELYPALTT